MVVVVVVVVVVVATVVITQHNCFVVVIIGGVLRCAIKIHFVVVEIVQSIQTMLCVVIIVLLQCALRPLAQTQQVLEIQ